MKFAPSIAAAAALLAALPAFAANTLIDFEGVTSFASVADYYNGGSDGAGVSGVNLGLAFSGAALALSNDGLADSPSGNYFSNAPSAGSVMFVADSSAVLNVAKGFTGEISFYYSAVSSEFDVVQIYSGLDASGSSLGSVSLSRNAQLGGCGDSPYCNWQQITLSFAGTGQSISFGGVGNVAFDNIAITAVPEPETYGMMALGLAGLMVAMRRQRKD